MDFSCDFSTYCHVQTFMPIYRELDSSNAQQHKEFYPKQPRCLFMCSSSFNKAFTIIFHTCATEVEAKYFCKSLTAYSAKNFFESQVTV